MKCEGQGESKVIKAVLKSAFSHLPPIVQNKDSTSNDTQHYVSDDVKKTEDGDLDSKAEIGGNETGGREVLDYHNHVCDDDDLTDFLYEESEVQVHTEQGQEQGVDQEPGEKDESKGNEKENNSQSDTGDTVSLRKIGAGGSGNDTSIVIEVSEEKVEALGVVPVEPIPVLSQAVHAAEGKGGGGGGGLRKITKKKLNRALAPDPELQLQLQPLPLPLPHGDANTVTHGDGDGDGGAISAVAVIEITANPVSDDDNADYKNISIDGREFKYAENGKNDAQDVEIEVEAEEEGEEEGEKIEAAKMQIASLVKKNDRAVYCELPLSVAALAEDADNGKTISGEGQKEVDENLVNAVIADEDGAGRRVDAEEGGREVSPGTQIILPFKADAIAPLCENEVEIDLAEIKDEDEDEVAAGDVEDVREGQGTGQSERQIKEQMPGQEQEQEDGDDVVTTEETVSINVYKATLYMNTEETSRALDEGDEDEVEIKDEDDEDEEEEEGVVISHAATSEHPTLTCLGDGTEGDVKRKSDDLCSMQVDGMVVKDEGEVLEEKEAEMDLNPGSKEDERSLNIELIASEVGEACATLDKRSNNSSDLDGVKSIAIESSCISSEDKDKKVEDNGDEDEVDGDEDEDNGDEGRQKRDCSHVEQQEKEVREEKEDDVLEVPIPSARSPNLPVLLFGIGISGGERIEVNDDIGNSNDDDHGIYKKHDDGDDEAFYEDYKDEEEDEAISSPIDIHSDEIINPQSQLIGSGSRSEWGKEEMEHESEDDVHHRPPSLKKLSDCDSESDRVYSKTPSRNGHVGVSTSSNSYSDSSGSSSSNSSSNSYTEAPTSLSATNGMKNDNNEYKKEDEDEVADSNIGSIPMRTTLEATQTSSSASKSMAIDGLIRPYDFPLKHRTTATATANGQYGDGADSRTTRTNDFDGKSSNSSSSGAGASGSAEHTAVSAAAMLAIKQALLDAAKWGLEEQEQEQGRGHGRVLDGGDSEEEEERKRRKEKKKLKKKEDEERGIYRGSTGKDVDIEDEDYFRGLQKKKKKDKDKEKEKKSSSKSKDRDKDRVGGVDEGGQQREKRKKYKKSGSSSSSVKKVADALSDSHDEEGGLEDLEEDLDF